MTTIEVAEEQKSSMLATAELVLKYPPNVDWMLVVMSQMAPGHAIFAKDYVAPKQERATAAAVAMPMLNNL